MESEKAPVLEKLDASSGPCLPSMLLLKKRPWEESPEARSQETAALKKRGGAMLDRIKQFIPEMEESERILQERVRTADNPDSLDIENVEEGAPAVEFDLALFEYSSSDESEDTHAEADVTDSSFSSLTDEDDEADKQDDEVVFLKKRKPGALTNTTSA